jgi:hypothetical protein
MPSTFTPGAQPWEGRLGWEDLFVSAGSPLRDPAAVPSQPQDPEAETLRGSENEIILLFTVLLIDEIM